MTATLEQTLADLRTVETGDPLVNPQSPVAKYIAAKRHIIIGPEAAKVILARIDELEAQVADYMLGDL